MIKITSRQQMLVYDKTRSSYGGRSLHLKSILMHSIICLHICVIACVDSLSRRLPSKPISLDISNADVWLNKQEHLPDLGHKVKITILTITYVHWVDWPLHLQVIKSVATFNNKTVSYIANQRSTIRLFCWSRTIFIAAEHAATP